MWMYKKTFILEYLLGRTVLNVIMNAIYNGGKLAWVTPQPKIDV